MAASQIKKCIWILEQIYRTGGIGYKELVRRWDDYMYSDYGKLSNSTFRTYVRQIEDIFDITIECEHRDEYRYYISSENDLATDSIRSKLLNAFSINNLLSESKGLRGKILYENIPSKDKFMIPIMEAIRDSLTLRIDYRPFYHSEPGSHTVAPYCLKIHKNRWYVLVKEGGMMIHLALDRISSLTVLEDHFKPDSQFDVERFYDGVFGVIASRDELDVETVIVKVRKDKADYLQALPLHSSQGVVEADANSVTFRYRLMPTRDFISEILSMGSAAKILSPQWVADELKWEYTQALGQYK